MELDIWKGDWGLASVDINSLKIATYAKFLGAPIKFVEKNNPLFTPKGSFPVFRCGKHVFNTFEEVTEYLKTYQNFNADGHLTREQQSTAWAFCNYLDQKLYPCLQYIWWVDATDSGQEMRNWFAKNIQFPFNYYYPGQFENRAKDLIDILYGEEPDIKEVHCDIYRAAEKCFSDLSTMLGEQEFFFGKNPSSLDASAFAYVALILKVPQKNSTLANTLKSYNNLVQFASRISQRYFPIINGEFIGKNKKTDKQQEEEKKTKQRTRDKVFAGIFASVAMTLYAISKGILQLNLKEKIDEYHYMPNLEDDDDDYD